MQPDLQGRSSQGGHLLVPGVWWGALTRRYRSRPPARGNYGIYLDSGVQPVTDVDRLLDRPRFRQTSTASIVADGVTYLFSVPDGKRWDVWGFVAARSPSTPLGAFAYSVGIEDAQPTALNMDLNAAATVATTQRLLFGTPLPLAPGWRPFIRVVQWTVAGVVDFTLLATEYDVSDERTPLTT